MTVALSPTLAVDLAAWPGVVLHIDAAGKVSASNDAAGLEALAKKVAPTVRLTWTTVAADVPEVAAREDASLVILDIGSRNGVAWRWRMRSPT